MSFVSVSPQIPVSETIGITSSNAENSIMTRLDDKLFVCYGPSNTPNSSVLMKIRAINADNGTAFGEPITTRTTVSTYHSQGSLFSDLIGRLHVFQGSSWSYASFPWTSWSTPTTMTSRAGVDVVTGGTTIDTSGVLEPSTGDIHIVNQYSGALQCDGFGPASPGVSLSPTGRLQIATLWRIPSGATQGGSIAVDGPYKIVDTGFSTQIKRGLKLGKETSGQRSLHLFWIIRYSFETVANGFATYGIYYAKSTDNGANWTNASGTKTLPRTGNGISILAYSAPGTASAPQYPGYYDTLTDSLGVAIPPHPIAKDDWSNWSYYQVYDGNVGQECEHATEICSDGYPIVVFPEYVSGGDVVTVTSEVAVDGIPYQPPTSGNMIDTFHGSPTYRLSYRKWNGTSWSGGVINSSLNFKDTRPKVRVDKNGRIFVFLGGISGQGLIYFKSEDNGRNWSNANQLYNETQGRTTAQANANTVHSYADPHDPNIHHLCYDDTDEYRWYMRIRLTDNTVQNQRSSPFGFRNRYRPVSGPKMFRGRVGRSTGKIPSYRTDN